MQLSLKALFLAAALAVATADEPQKLRGLQNPPPAATPAAPAAAAPAPTFSGWAAEINNQIAQLRQAQGLPALKESPALFNSSTAAAKEYSEMTGTNTLMRNNDLALQKAKAANYTGTVVKEYVAKVKCGSKTREDCAKSVVDKWKADEDVVFAAGYAADITEIGSAVDDTTNNELVFVTHVGKAK